jgi:long-chain acyl-CoA synthetase
VLNENARVAADELIAHCKKNLAPYKVPSQIHLVDALPRTTVGKIDKAALRERLASEGQTSSTKKGGHGLQG